MAEVSAVNVAKIVRLLVVAEPVILAVLNEVQSDLSSLPPVWQNIGNPIVAEAKAVLPRIEGFLSNLDQVLQSLS